VYLKTIIAALALGLFPSLAQTNAVQHPWQKMQMPTAAQVEQTWKAPPPDKGGQGWITYHLSGNEWLQVGVRNQKAARDFIPGGTTLNDISFQVVKRIGKDFEVNGNFAYERWKAPIYLSRQQTVTTTSIQLTWFPQRKVSF